MKRTTLAVGGLFVATLLTLGLATAPAVGDDDRNERAQGGRWNNLLVVPGLDVAPVDNPMYEAECGACHFVYQPGLLPARSWERVMEGLDAHFGENAELDAEVRRLITVYLRDNAADRSEYRRSVGITGSLRGGESPLRISETPYFQRKHHEVPARLVSGNEKVGSWSHCDRCHTEAATGSYNEHQVRIPGAGRWDD